MINQHKYKAKRTEIDGNKFTSLAEARRYSQLVLLEKAGKINALELQPRFLLQEGYIRNGKKVRKIEYVADFRYQQGDNLIVEDVKGMKTPVYLLKIKILLYLYPAMILKEIKNNKEITL